MSTIDGRAGFRAEMTRIRLAQGAKPSARPANPRRDVLERVRRWNPRRSAKELANSARILGRIPFSRSHITLDDPTIAIQQQRLGHTHCLVSIVYGLVQIEQNRKGESIAFLKRTHVVCLAVDRDGDQLEFLSWERLIEPIHRRHFAFTGFAPGRPKIHQYDPALEIREYKVVGLRTVHPLDRFQTGQFKVRSDRAALDWRCSRIARKDEYERPNQNRRTQQKPRYGGSLGIFGAAECLC